MPGASGGEALQTNFRDAKRAVLSQRSQLSGENFPLQVTF